MELGFLPLAPNAPPVYDFDPKVGVAITEDQSAVRWSAHETTLMEMLQQYQNWLLIGAGALLLVALLRRSR